MPNNDEPLSVEDVRARAALAGVTLDEDTIEDITATMEAALSTLRKLDLREIRLVEPAVAFNAAWSE